MRRLLVLLAGLLLLLPAAATARVALLPEVCHAVATADAPPAALAYRCAGRPDGYQDRWLWLRVDPAAVRALPPGFELLVDQGRFRTLALIAVRADGGSTRQTIDGGRLQPGEWALGGQLRFSVAAGGAPVTGLYVGFERLDWFGTMRKLDALDPAGLVRLEAGWLLLLGLFGGATAASLIGGLFTYAALRVRFQLWYSLWAASTLAYGLCWSGLIFTLLPGLGVAATGRANYLLVGLCALFAVRFFAAYVEDGLLPRTYRRLLNAGGGLCAAAGAIAAADWLVPAAFGDRLFNLALVAEIALLVTGIALAAVAGSRSVWFYLIAWTPPLAVVLLRIGRNFGLTPQSDAIDMATFTALAAQAVLLAIGVADRYAELLRERNAGLAAQAQLRALSETDALTGLANRRGLVDRTAAALIRSSQVGMILIDLDHFKAINDRHGHAAGDHVLRAVGQRLAELTRRGDVCARLGGEEFAVLVETAGRTELLELAERLREGIAGLPPEMARGCRLGASLGVAHAPDLAYPRFETLCEAADVALYRAKAEGRNRVVLSAPAAAAPLPARLRVAG